MTLGEFIRKYCDEHGMSLQQFAENANMSKAYVSMIVRGKNPSTGKPVSPTLESYENIAAAAGTTLYDLLQITEKDIPTSFHTVTEAPKIKAPNRYKDIVEAIIARLAETNADEILKAVLSQDELHLIRSYRAAEEYARKVALQTLENNPIVAGNARA